MNKFEENHLKYNLHTFIVDAEELIHRDLSNHLKYLDLISTKWTGWHSTTYGINNSSILFKLKGFDIITKYLPSDIMHSILKCIKVLQIAILICCFIT